MASLVYNIFKSEIMKGDLDLDNAAHVVKVALYTASLTTANVDDDSYSSSPYTANQVAAGGGYSTGGATLATKTVTVDDTGDRGLFNGDDVTWGSSTITARYALVYSDTHATKVPICLIDFGSDKVSSNGNFTIQWDNTANAIISIT